MNSFGLTDKGKVRHQNQDTFFVSCDNGSRVAVLIVCDGMGGARAGNVASDLACKIFSDTVMKSLTPDTSPDGVKSLMQEALKLANVAVYELSLCDTDCHGMGTTLVSAVITENRAYVLNVGDSRAYRINADGITQITRDHSVVEDMIARGNITREQSRNHPNKNLITRAVGTAPNVSSDIFELDIKDGEKLLLCSDGLSNLVEDKELLEEILKTDDLAACGKALMDIAAKRGAPDNVTLALFDE